MHQKPKLPNTLNKSLANTYGTPNEIPDDNHKNNNNLQLQRIIGC